jgi:predicted amino acid dehydrogenase
MAACVSLAAVDLIVKEKYAETALRKGVVFKMKLKAVAEKFPDIIESVEGKGLMLGVHFNKLIGRKNILLRGLYENELLGYLLAGWLFHNKKIRVLPSLSKPDSIRIEPSVYISGKSINIFCNALEELCLLCRNGKMYELLRYLMNDDPYLDKSGKNNQGKFPVQIEEPQPGALKVGFIGNFTNPPKELMLIEPDLQRASDTGLRILFNKMQSLLDGKSVRLFSKNLMNGKIHFTFYTLPFDTAHLEVIHRWGRKRYYISRIQETVDLLIREGVSHIGLGAHTSILSGNGLYLAESKKVKILTGNTMTVASCLYHMERYFENISHEIIGPVTIAIAGANGNIGSGLAGCLDDEKYANTKIILAGNNLKKLEILQKKIFTPQRSVECTTDLFLLQKADIIISCTNTNDPLIFPDHIHTDKEVFIIDIAVPGSVSEDVKQLKNVKFCKEAASVYMPDDQDFVISTHTQPGKVFCCAAEVMLAALYDVQLPLKGRIQPESIKAMMQLAMLEGLFNNKEYAPLV